MVVPLAVGDHLGYKVDAAVNATLRPLAARRIAVRSTEVYEAVKPQILSGGSLASSAGTSCSQNRAGVFAVRYTEDSPVDRATPSAPSRGYSTRTSLHTAQLASPPWPSPCVIRVQVSSSTGEAPPNAESTPARQATSSSTAAAASVAQASSSYSWAPSYMASTVPTRSVRVSPEGQGLDSANVVRISQKLISPSVEPTPPSTASEDIDETPVVRAQSSVSLEDGSQKAFSSAATNAAAEKLASKSLRPSTSLSASAAKDSLAQSDEDTASTKSSEHECLNPGTRAARSLSGRSTEAPMRCLHLPGDPVAFDECGQPIILRHVDVETGKTRHIVRNEDGSVRTYGQNTVDSLLNSKEEDSRKWLDSLTARDLRGIVHEMGRNLVQSSQQYQRHQEELSKFADDADYSFFGLTPDCTEKDLDNAYRRLAKRMHPDKNGGTEQAKQIFQTMKERYEGLKSRRSQGQGSSASRDNEEADDDIHSEEEGSQGNCLEDVDGDGKRKRRNREKQDNGRIEFDPTDRLSLEKTVWKMLGQLRSLSQGLKDISSKLSRFRNFRV
eukprot:TRINITY_DN8512_c0_g1_i2.p1 TRINITY_DN8512_c0_g1~~TRINITY_DN8512_c0_g1_i2.p1  ORF type:complete len:576 (-),score=102.66 TRINITY_DN8512_c0_g1_i2:61-1728(-)